MSHKKASTDPGKDLHLYSRIGMYNEKVFSVFNADGTDYDFTDVGIDVGVKRNRGDDDFLTLTEGDGVIITDNDIHFVFSEDQSSLFTQRAYYWQLRRTIDGNKKVWLNGDHDWHNGKFDAFNNNGETITISEDGETVSITIQESGISQAELDAALALKADLNTRSITAASTATLTPNVDNYDLFEITAQSQAITIAEPTGTPVNGNGFVIRITDNGTGRAITWNAIYRAFGSSLPTTTTANKTLYIAVVYNSTDIKFDVIGVVEEV